MDGTREHHHPTTTTQQKNSNRTKTKNIKPKLETHENKPPAAGKNRRTPNKNNRRLCNINTRTTGPATGTNWKKLEWKAGGKELDHGGSEKRPPWIWKTTTAYHDGHRADPDLDPDSDPPPQNASKTSMKTTTNTHKNLPGNHHEPENHRRRRHHRPHQQTRARTLHTSKKTEQICGWLNSGKGCGTPEEHRWNTSQDLRWCGGRPSLHHKLWLETL